MPNEDDEFTANWRTTCPVCGQLAQHILDGRKGCENCTRDCTLEEVTAMLWKESARLREVKAALNAAIRERGSERLRSDEMPTTDDTLAEVQRMADREAATHSAQDMAALQDAARRHGQAVMAGAMRAARARK